MNHNGTGLSDTPLQASYDAANRMTAVTLQLPEGDKRYDLTHDANGNLTRKANAQDSADTTDYRWDSQNRLVGLVQPALQASFVYDALGRRVQVSITRAGQPTATVQYLYEGLQALGEIREGRLTHRLLVGLQLDEVIARLAIAPSGQKDPAASRLYLTDALNSVIAQLGDEANAALQNSYAYSPYGQSQTIGPDTTANPIQYTGRENDGSNGTGLYYYRARYYDAVLKRFISRDPIGLAGGWNEYGYVGGDPISFTDPDGLCPCGDVVDLIQLARADKRDWSKTADRRDVNKAFGEGAYKCNLFADEQYENAGYNLPNVGGMPWSKGKYPPGAGQLSDSSFNLSGWPRVDGPTQPGDLVAHGGHVGIATSSSTTISASPNGKVENNWGFRKGQVGVVIRRCSCGQ